jgi:hypothetical protein
MPYRMRYFDTSDEPLLMKDIEGAMKREDPAYRLEIFADSKRPLADLYLGDAVYAQIEINQPGDGLFNEEIQEMLEFLVDAQGRGRKRVENVLKTAKRTIAVQVLSQGRESEETLSGIDPLWKWLFLMRKGLLHADGEGYYDEDELVLEDA